MPAIVPFIPLIAQGAGLGIGALAGKKAEKGAMKRSPEEQAALTGAQGAAGQALGQASSLSKEARPYISKPAGYYQTLLHGNRAAMAQATAAPKAAITEHFRGAQRNLAQSGIRGAARDVASTDLNRARASSVAGLTTGVQPYAAQQLAGLGQNLLQNTQGLYGTAGNVYSNLLGQGARNREYARKEGAGTAGAIGGLVADVGKVLGGVLGGDKQPGYKGMYEEAGGG